MRTKKLTDSEIDRLERHPPASFRKEIRKREKEPDVTAEEAYRQLGWKRRPHRHSPRGNQ
jgi:hypothetical protein